VPRSGISYSSILEWELAAQWWGYKPEEFEELDGEIQSARVATYRAQNTISSVVAYEQAKEMKRKQPKRKGKH
jgi:hypothetical protein